MKVSKHRVLVFLVVGAATLWGGIDYGPYLTCPSTAGATVQFGKSLWDSARIDWDDSAGYFSDGSLDNSVDISSLDIRASFSISGYSPGTLVFYKVIAGDESSPVYSFRTMPLPGSPMRFCIYGDCRTNEEVHTAVCERMFEKNPALVIHTGDLGDAAWSIDDWDSYFDATDTIAARVPYISTIGNHEIPYDIYKYLFDLPNNEEWYAIHAGCLSIISINVYNSYLVGSEQYNWLLATLTDSIPSTTRWIIINEHESPYSTSNHGSNLIVRSVLKPLYDSLGVHVVAAGHDHCYEHSYVDGIHYFVAGGGGAPLYSVSGGEFTIHCERSYHYISAYADDEDLCFTVLSEEDVMIERFCYSDFVLGIKRVTNPSGIMLEVSPNPFNTELRIGLDFGFDIPHSPSVEIYNVNGAMVRTLSKPDRDGVSGRFTRQNLLWDGRDNSGVDLAGGCYFVVARAGGKTASKKVLLIK